MRKQSAQGLSSSEEDRDEPYAREDRQAIDPRRRAKGARKPARKPDHKPASRKAKQLSQQVGETIDAVLAGDARNDILRNLRVVSVEPAPDASRLLVTVAPLEISEGLTPSLLIEHLEKASARLRAEVASAITRKRAPVLTYRIVWP